MSQNNSLVGQVDLLSLLGASYLNVNGKDSIVIPTGDNPSIFVSTTKNGTQKAYLDIVIRECPNNQFGNTHFVKASIGKSNRERLNLSREDVNRCSPIIGNLRVMESSGQNGNQSAEGGNGFKGF